MKPGPSSRRPLESTPPLRSLHPAASRWIGAIIRMTSPHPAMTRILEVIERLSEQPYRTSFVLTGEPGTGKDGLARALAHLTCPGGPIVRYDVVGFPEEEALDHLCGVGRRAGVAEAADGGTILIEELAGLGPRTQAALLRLLKSGRCERRGGGPLALPALADDVADATRADSKADSKSESKSDSKTRRLDVRVIAMSDRDLAAEVAAGRLRHDLYYRLGRIALWLPPLRERIEDLAPATIWMGNRVLGAAGLPFELLDVEQYRRATPAERARAIALDPGAVRALEQHTWPGNFRELEAVLERALLLYRTGQVLRAEEIRSALAMP